MLNIPVSTYCAAEKTDKIEVEMQPELGLNNYCKLLVRVNGIIILKIRELNRDQITIFDGSAKIEGGRFYK